MTRYADLAAESAARHEEAAYRRRRLLAALRGWFYENGSPRWVVSLAFAVSAAAAGLIAYSLARLSWEASVCGFVGVLLAGPLFLFMVSKYVESKWSQMGEIRDWARFVSADRATPVLSPPWFEKLSEETQGGIGEVVGSTGFAGTVIISAATGGAWLIYELVRLSPELLAEMALDGILAKRQPQLFARVETNPWPRDVALWVLPYFLGLALCVSVVILFAGLWLM